jgi:carbohydrate kinase (thermoresistant glucokinase family)
MPRPVVVVMGVSGCGKTTVGRALAAALEVPFLEGDSLHAPESVRKMSAGIPLDDADREGWLDAIGERLQAASGSGLVASCSALKRVYRDRLRKAAPQVRFVFLHGSHALLAERMRLRESHFMPASMLESQLKTLEPPGDDEAPVRVDVARPVPAIVRDLQRALSS